jgi:hypothetical protein
VEHLFHLKIIPFELPNGGGAGTNRPVGGRFPIDLFFGVRRPALFGVDHRQSGIALLLPIGGRRILRYLRTAGSRLLSWTSMRRNPLGDLVQFVGDRVTAIPRQAVDAPIKEMGCKANRVRSEATCLISNASERPFHGLCSG